MIKDKESGKIDERELSKCLAIEAICLLSVGVMIKRFIEISFELYCSHWLE